MHMMKQKQLFVRPAVLQDFALLPETSILQGSVSDNTTVVSTGQEVQEYDFSGDNYNHQWE